MYSKIGVNLLYIQKGNENRYCLTGLKKETEGLDLMVKMQYIHDSITKKPESEIIKTEKGEDRSLDRVMYPLFWVDILG